MDATRQIKSSASVQQFSVITKSALTDRQRLLSEYREFAKRARDKAGIEITKEPQVRAEAQKIRKLAQKILRRRYYMEGDWRGETPVKREELP